MNREVKPLTEPRSLEDKIDELLALQKSQTNDNDFDSYHTDKDAISVESWLELSNTRRLRVVTNNDGNSWAIGLSRTEERLSESWSEVT